MSMFDNPINAADLPEDTGSGSFAPVPAGTYQASIKSAELAKTKDGAGQYIKMRLDIGGPTHAGRVVFANINIKNASAQAEAIGRGQLRSVMAAIGLATLVDTDQLVGYQLMIKLAIREARTDQATGKAYEAANEVKAYGPVVGATPPAPMGATNHGMPRAAAATPAPSGATPPWAKRA